MSMIDWEQKAANMAEYLKSKRDRIMSDIFYTSDEVDYAQWVASPSQEREDIELANLLREVADRIERKYK